MDGISASLPIAEVWKLSGRPLVHHAGFEIRLAGSGNPRIGTTGRRPEPAELTGIKRVSALQARLKGPSELKPASSAQC
jgi:hypothetical protein